MAENNSKYITRLLHMFMRGRFSSDAEKKVQGWFCDESDREEKDNALREYYDSMPTYESAYSRVTLREIKIRLGFGKNRRLLRRITRIAALLLPAAVVLGAVYINHYNEMHRRVEMITAEVNDGVQRMVTLPDGSEVWLNQGTKLEYPARFGKVRTVSLSGEAFFDVAREEDAPFEVRTEKLSIRVLGTEFNVNARPDSPEASVTLISGSVEVAAGAQTHSLRPLEKLVFDKANGQVTVTHIEPNANDWRSTKLNFNKMMLCDIFRTLATYYGATITTASPQSYDEPITVRLSGDESKEAVMQMLSEISGRFRYETHGDTIIVQPITQTEE